MHIFKSDLAGLLIEEKPFEFPCEFTFNHDWPKLTNHLKSVTCHTGPGFEVKCEGGGALSVQVGNIFEIKM